MGRVRVAVLLVTAGLAAGCASNEGPTCEALRDAGEVERLAAEIYDSELAPDSRATEGGPEDDPRVRARYRRDLMRSIERRVSELCASRPEDHRPREVVVEEFRD